MPSRHFLFVVGGRIRIFRSNIAIGADSENPRADVATAHAAINGRDGGAIEITANQWQFLRGVYAMNPEASPGLPYGDNAVLLQNGGESEGLLFFFDSDKAVPPVHAPPTQLLLMQQIAGDDKPRDVNQEDLRA